MVGPQQTMQHPVQWLLSRTHLTALFRHRLSADSVGLSFGMRLPQRAPCTSLDQQRPSACEAAGSIEARFTQQHSRQGWDEAWWGRLAGSTHNVT